MFIISKEFNFSASHQLKGLPLEHPCGRLHGHNYTVKFTFSSGKLDETGFVVDYRKLDTLKTWIDETFDHRHLNECVRFNPTAELLARHFFDEASVIFPQLRWVEVRETERTAAIYDPLSE